MLMLAEKIIWQTLVVDMRLLGLHAVLFLRPVMDFFNVKSKSERLMSTM